MSIYPQTPGNRTPGIMIPVSRLARSTAPTFPSSYIPNTPEALYLTQGSDSDLTVTWTAPAVDTTHSAATAFNLRFSLAGANAWTVRSNVSSPYVLSGLAAGTAFDVQIQGANTAGQGAWSTSATMTTSASASAPNAPTISAVTPPPDGTTDRLVVTWTAPAIDGGHSAATGYNLRHRSSGGGNWTTAQGVTSPHSITGLTGASAIDVEVQATDAAGDPSGWSDTVTATTWGATVEPGIWTAATAQAHGAPVAPNGGVQLTAIADPTEITGAAFAWSLSQSAIPVGGFIVAGPNGQPNGWGQWFDAPATPGTYYLWMLVQGAGGVTIGALVSSAITVA